MTPPPLIRKSQQVIKTIGGLLKRRINFAVVFSLNISHNNSFVVTSEVSLFVILRSNRRGIVLSASTF